MAIPKPNDWCIDLHNVSKTYRGRIRALDGIEMQVAPGEVFGLLGPNGAGKSTLVKIMMTVVHPSHAEGTVLGQRVGHKPTLRRIGYLPEHHRFPPYLKGAEALDYYAALCGVPRVERRRRTATLLERVGMSEWANTPVSRYSKGMLQRVGLAQALVNDPALVVLDEPTDGVDPVGRKEIRDILAGLRAEGRTIFLNSHLLSEVEMICDRVAILVQGRVVQQGTIADLTSHSRRYEIEFNGSAPEWIGEIEGAKVAGGSNGRTMLAIPGDDPVAAQPILDRLRREGIVVTRFTPRVESLEELFMRAVSNSPRLAGGERAEASAALRAQVNAGQT